MSNPIGIATTADSAQPATMRKEADAHVREQIPFAEPDSDPMRHVVRGGQKLSVDYLEDAQQASKTTKGRMSPMRRGFLQKKKK